eukprot:COSAG04_NODE_960_length_9157_cov_6.389269_7_plen_168_part_00
MAYVAAGAIRVLGAAVSTLLVDQSVFEANAVRVPADGGDVDVNVRLNTGAFEIGSDNGYHVPIWRIDDGPVYGISWDQCQHALLRSEEAVGKGLPPPWPNLKCANVSYTGPDSSFSHVVALPQGLHTLWTGVLVMVRNVVFLFTACHPRESWDVERATKSRVAASVD